LAYKSIVTQGKWAHSDWGQSKGDAELEKADGSNPSTWDPALDAVIAAPRNHKVLFENDPLRVLEVTLEHDDEEPASPSVAISVCIRCSSRTSL
jgi:hypothetical protein